MCQTDNLLRKLPLKTFCFTFLIFAILSFESVSTRSFYLRYFKILKLKKTIHSTKIKLPGYLFQILLNYNL